MVDCDRHGKVDGGGTGIETRVSEVGVWRRELEL